MSSRGKSRDYVDFSLLFLCKFFRVILLLCGGNIDTTVFGRCLERGLAAEGRLLRYIKLFGNSNSTEFFPLDLL
jgi:hypothetical protein